MGRLSDPISDLWTRITTANVDGGTLEGFTVSDKHVEETVGVKDMPFVRIAGVAIEESFKTSAKAFATIKLSLLVESNKTFGVSAHIEDVEKVLDVIDQSTGLVKALKGAATFHDVSATTEPDKMSFRTDVTLTLVTRQYERGLRCPITETTTEEEGNTV